MLSLLSQKALPGSGPCLLWGSLGRSSIGQDMLFLISRRLGLVASDKGRGDGVRGWRLPGTWLVAQGALGPAPSFPPGEGTGPAVMPFVLALGLGAAVLSEECGTIERTQ